mgnify:CR=1 FL=1
MRIAIGSDHGGLDLKTAIKAFLTEHGHTVTDHGTHSRDSVDYPDYAQAVGRDIRNGTADYGVLICTTGLGICMAANKQPGIRAAVLHNEDAARFSRTHNGCNCACYGQKYHTPYMAQRTLEIFLSATFEGGRHERRIAKLEAAAHCG